VDIDLQLLTVDFNPWTVDRRPSTKFTTFAAMKKTRVLFVCLGNICRSPLGAAIMKKKIRERGLESLIEVDSCGTSNYHIGDNADPRTIASAKKHGVAIDHCARQLTSDDLDHFDFVLAMDKSNYQNILRLAKVSEQSTKVRLMRAFDPVSQGADVPDPYHGGEIGFQEVYEILDRATDGFINFLNATP
jgi:protein-tyrosine phosphatase